MAEECGRSAEADKAAVPLADGGADDHTEEVRPDGGTPGIYRMTLCKTEKSQTAVISAERAPVPGKQGQAQAHPSDRICRRIPCFFLEKEERGQRLCRCPRTFAAIGIMTDSFPCRVRKNGHFLLYWDQWDYREEMVMGYTEEKLNSLDKETIIQLFLAQQEQLRQIDPKPPACTGAAGRPEKTPFRQVIGET